MSTGTFFGVYKGICVNNVDPAGLHRITALCPQVFGDGVTQSNWAFPCFAPGTTPTVPATGACVWLAFEGGDEDYPMWLGQWK
jgi:hypothetical protein